MIRTSFAVAVAMAVPGVPAFAAPTAGATHQEAGGPASGRSPHKAYRQVASNGDCRAHAIHVPAGKLPHYGTHQVAGTCDKASGLAAADGDRAARRD